VENERQRNLSDQVRHQMAMLNLASAEMDAVVGFGLGIAPRVAIPSPIPVGNYTGINVQNSTVGVLNTAAVSEISSYIGAMPTGNNAKDAISSFTQAVVDEAALSNADKKAILEQLTVIAAQAAATPAERKTGLIIPILSGIAKSATAVTAVAGAWKVTEPILKAHFGL
jgi:hypothetical protein